MSDTDDDAAPGWEAIDAALQPLYGEVEPLHWATILKWRLGGPDPLDGISAYDAGDHWHFVSYGMSELYGKESDNPDESGWGFEFTFRLAKNGAEEPPVWAASMMQNLARYVWQSGNVFAPGHSMPLNGPIALGEDTVIHAILFVLDPELGSIDTPHGQLRFLQIVGVSNEERLDAAAWNTLGVADLLRDRSPLWVTDLSRDSLHDDPEFAEAVRTGLNDEGSSAAVTFVPDLGWEVNGAEVAVTVGAIAVPQIRRVVPGRVLFGREHAWIGEESQIILRPTEGPPHAAAEGDALVLYLGPELARQFEERLRPVSGRYELDGITIFVEPTEVRDTEGKLLRTIG